MNIPMSEQPSRASSRAGSRASMSRSVSEMSLRFGEQGDKQLKGLPLLNAGAACLYMRSNQEYGSRQPGLGPPKFGLSNRFTSYLGDCGPYRNNGLSATAMPHSRFMDGTNDWVHKLSGPSA
eukprot:TRINITY_DN16571_c0_g1_i1.p2 TRINITY_DN16571_c0_g1~~TRINITY_DN16571_c0_g1_i1.p2  ORF type:complete len:122 (-),score=20.01 TRINITY_DN16571_c0_g1_i1:367-732(-)